MKEAGSTGARENPQPRAKVARKTKKGTKDDTEAEVVAAIRAYTAATVSKATEPAKPSGDPYELYAMSLVPDFRRLAEQSQRKFALLKAKLAAMMVEIEFDDQIPPATSERSSSVQHRPDASHWGMGSGFSQLPYPSLSTPTPSASWNVDQRYQRQPDPSSHPWYAGSSSLMGSWPAPTAPPTIPTIIPTSQARRSDDSLASILAASITGVQTDDQIGSEQQF